MLEAVERKATHQTPLLLLRNMLAKMYLAKYQGGVGKVPGSFGDSKPLGKQVYIPKGMDKRDIPFINKVEKNCSGEDRDCLHEPSRSRSGNIRVSSCD